MISCYICGEELYWQNNFTYDEVGLEGNGILHTLYCNHCESSYEIMQPLPKLEVRE